MFEKAYWITWEDHRRSRELAKALSIEYVPLLHKGERYIRYPVLSLRTLLFVLKNRPKLIFCQNPSIVLSSFLVFLKPLFGYVLVMDRHTNFKFSTENSRELKWRLFHVLSRYVNASADLTIVTNEYLKQLVDRVGGRGFVLQDKLPAIHGVAREMEKKFHVMFISTFSEDEPIEEVFEAARILGSKYRIHVTGNYAKFNPINSGQLKVPRNVELTGYLEETDYQDLLASVDVVMVITDMEYTLTCGAYEAVAVGKPMVLSDTKTIRSYFTKGAHYARPIAAEIADQVCAACDDLRRLEEEVAILKHELEKDWSVRFANLRSLICDLGGFPNSLKQHN